MNRPKRSICWNCKRRSECKEEKTERRDCENYLPLTKCENAFGTMVISRNAEIQNQYLRFCI